MIAEKVDSNAVPSAFPDGELQDAAELGAVDDRSVRVWGRLPGGPELQAQLRVDGHDPVLASVPLSAETDWTGVVTLSLPEPAPGQPFTCLVNGRRLTARFGPSPVTREGFTFAFGSCHRPFEPEKDGRIGFNSGAGLYSPMIDELRAAEARFLLLVGDQIYSDEIDLISVRDNLPGDEQHPPSLQVAVNAYRRVARGYLGHPGFRALREAFPTYCMWDDHDIFNNWGSRLTESPLDRRMFEAATRVYGEYQHPRNPGGKIGPPPFFYTFRYGTAGFVVLDLRGARDYRIGRLMGASQWEELRQYLAGPDAAEVETLFIVASVPVAHHSRWIVRLLGQLPEHFADDVRDRWCSPHFIASRNELLDELFAWQERAPGRQAVLLSGDVHCASAFTIGRRGQPGVIQQFTSSALSTPDTGFERFVNVVGSRAPNLFESRFRFKRRFLALENNFGLVQVEPLPAGGHRVTYSVRAWHPKRGKLMDGGRVVTVPRSGLPAKE